MTKYLGGVSILNLVSRPIPSAKDWIRMESETGRFSHHNLLSLSWAEVSHQVFQDREMELFHFITGELLSKEIFTTEVWLQNSFSLH